MVGPKWLSFATRFWRQLGLLGLSSVVLIMPLLLRSPYFSHILIMVLLFASLGEAWNVLGGYAGQLSLGHMVYFGIGAYASTYLQIAHNINPWIGLLLGALLAALFGIAVGVPTFRLKGRYFVMASIALLVLFQTVLLNIKALGAASGLIVTLQPSSLLSLQFSQKTPYVYLAFILLAWITGITFWIERSKMGYYLRTIREDEDIAASLGINTTLYKSIAMAISAFFTAIGGSFYAQYVLFIDPLSVVSLNKSFLIALLVILGGAGTIWGPILGAVILVPLSEISSALLGGGGKGVDLIIFGLMIIIVGIYQPDGVIGVSRLIASRIERRISNASAKRHNLQ